MLYWFINVCIRVILNFQYCVCDKIHALYYIFSNNMVYVWQVEVGAQRRKSSLPPRLRLLEVGVSHWQISTQMSSVGLWHWMQGHGQIMVHLHSWTGSDGTSWSPWYPWTERLVRCMHNTHGGKALDLATGVMNAHSQWRVTPSDHSMEAWTLEHMPTRGMVEDFKWEYSLLYPNSFFPLLNYQ